MGFWSRLFGKQGEGAALPLPPRSRFVPENSLEASLKRVANGDLPMNDFLEELLRSSLFVPSSSDAQASMISGQFRPIGYEHDGHGKMLIAFTAPSRLDDRVTGIFRSIRSAALMETATFLKMVPVGVGVHLNPGWAVALEMPGQGLASFKSDIGLLETN